MGFEILARIWGMWAALSGLPNLRLAKIEDYPPIVPRGTISRDFPASVSSGDVHWFDLLTRERQAQKSSLFHVEQFDLG